MTDPVYTYHPNYKKTLDSLADFSDVIEETVNFGTHILDWDIKEASGSDENIPIVMMFRQILELADSISILVRHSSIDPCKPLLRSLLESLLQLEFILETDSKERAINFLVWYYHERIKLYKKFEPTDPAHSDLIRKLKADKVMNYDKGPIVIKQLKSYIDNLEAILKLPLYVSAEENYQSVMKNKKIKFWCQLSSNILSVEQLSSHLNRHAFYEILYRNWSGATHGVDIIQSKLIEGDGNKIAPIRLDKDLRIVSHYAVTFCLLAYQAMMTKRVPQHKIEYGLWFKALTPRYSKLLGDILNK